jgi:peptidoglycan/xylan/chitin deacetylase (PgdA/CDA1 family)
MRLGLLLPNQGVVFGATTIPELLALAETAEQSGAFESLWVGDNLLAKPRLESVTLLSALAVRDGHEIVCHGYRWVDYQVMPINAEREHIGKAIEWFASALGITRLGWMTGRPSANTRRLLVETGAILYDRDALNDERPYWVRVSGQAHLVIPYSYETNDNRFNENSGFTTAGDFDTYLRDCFDVMYAEGARRAGIMSIGLHDRLIGRPGRFAGLQRFLEYARAHDGVWFCTGRDIAEHWMREHPAPV